MTIQLLQYYNGQAPGVYTLAGAEETRLIGLGLARAYTPGMDGQNPVFSNAEQLGLRGVVSTPGNVDALLDAIDLGVPLGQIQVASRRWNKALALMYAGVSNAYLNIPGDSVTGGSFSGPGDTSLKTHSPPSLLVKALNARGITARCDSVFGDQGKAAAGYQAYDPKFVLGAGWDVYASGGNPESLAGKMWTNSTTANAMAFTPEYPWNQCDIWHYASGTPQYTLDVGGAALKTVTVTNTSTVVKTTLSVADGLTLAAQTLNLKRVSGSPFVVGIECYDTTKPAVIVRNFGRGGWNAGNWDDDTAAFNPAKALQVVRADMNLINLGINDLSASTDLFDTRMTTIKGYIDLMSPAGDVALITPSYVTPSNTAYDIQDTFDVKLKELARRWGVRHMSLRARLGDYNTANALGAMYSTDGVHLRTPGSALYAELMLSRLFD